MDDLREAGRVGPCWDDVATQLLHVGEDRWLGVGCDVEGKPRWGESPECSLLRQRIAACLRGHPRARRPRPVAPEPRPRDDDCSSCPGAADPAGGSRAAPTS